MTHKKVEALLDALGLPKPEPCPTCGVTDNEKAEEGPRYQFYLLLRRHSPKDAPFWEEDEPTLAERCMGFLTATSAIHAAMAIGVPVVDIYALMDRYEFSFPEED
jgi:hypothetical protein